MKLALLLLFGCATWVLYFTAPQPFSANGGDSTVINSIGFRRPSKSGTILRRSKGLLEGAGLTDVAVRPCFGWVADGTKPA